MSMARDADASSFLARRWRTRRARPADARAVLSPCAAVPTRTQTSCDTPHGLARSQRQPVQSGGRLLVARRVLERASDTSRRLRLRCSLVVLTTAPQALSSTSCRSCIPRCSAIVVLYNIPPSASTRPPSSTSPQKRSLSDRTLSQAHRRGRYRHLTTLQADIGRDSSVGGSEDDPEGEGRRRGGDGGCKLPAQRLRLRPRPCCLHFVHYLDRVCSISPRIARCL